METETRPMTVGDWMVTLLVLAIPLVNLFMYLYWAFSTTGNVNRRTFCQACILWFLIIAAAFIVIGGLAMVAAMF